MNWPNAVGRSGPMMPARKASVCFSCFVSMAEYNFLRGCFFLWSRRGKVMEKGMGRCEEWQTRRFYPLPVYSPTLLIGTVSQRESPDLFK